eukprot:SAG11_NODE_2869_length_2884_cov_1.716338_4_plen_68_part_00
MAVGLSMRSASYLTNIDEYVMAHWDWELGEQKPIKDDMDESSDRVLPNIDPAKQDGRFTDDDGDDWL